MTHIVPRRTYYLIFAALIVCTFITVLVSYFDLGPYNAVVALVIAVIKATLVVLFFMHVRYEPKLTWIFVAAGLIWFLIMVDLTMSDYLTRSDPGNPQDAFPSQSASQHRP